MNKARTFLLLLFVLPASHAQEAPRLEAYGAIQEVTLMMISPSGRTVAYRSSNDDQDGVVVVDLDNQQFITS